MPVFDWAKVPTGIGRHKALERLPVAARLMFLNLLVDLWGQDPPGHFTYRQAMHALGGTRSALAAFRPLLERGLVAHQRHSCDTLATDLRHISDTSATHLRETSTFIIVDYGYWSCGGWDVSPAQTARNAIKSSDGNRSASRARAGEEKRRDNQDRTPSGSVRSWGPGAAPRDARSAARRQADEVVGSVEELPPPVLVGEIVGQEIDPMNTGEIRGSESEVAKAALAQIRETLSRRKASDPHSTGQDAYLGNPEWKRHREMTERAERAEREQLGYLYSGEIPPPAPDAEQ